MAKEKTDYFLITAGLESKFGTFKYGLNYTHGDSVHTMDTSGLYDNKKLYAAVDAILVNGVPTCRVLTDPTMAAQYAGCTPINVLRGDPSVATPAGYAYAIGTSRYRATIKQDSVTANISGSLFDLPAGPVDFAAGAEYRKQTLLLTTNADPGTLAGTSTDPTTLAAQTTAIRSTYFAGLRGVPTGALYYWLTNAGSGAGSYDVKEGFAEVAVPLLKDKPGFRELSVNGAVRVTNYSTSGTVTTYKVGGSWRPVDGLLLRGTYSRDIRAPNLFELFAGPQSGIGIVLDPVSGQSLNVARIVAGNPNLKPEKAKTLTIFPTSIRIAPANIAFIKTSGIDFDLTYRSRVGKGALALRLYASYLNKFDTQLFTGAPTLHFAGVSVTTSNPAAYPRLRGNFAADYSTDRFGITVSEQMIGSMRLDNPGALPNGAQVQYVNPHVSAAFYTDLTLRAKVDVGGGKTFEPFLTINNMFDKDPPLIPGTTPGVNLPTNISVYDIVGRAYTAGVRFKF